MCGITGFVGEGTRVYLMAMTRKLAHRGPDDEAIHIDEEFQVFLGFRRLTVIDPAGGRQPMWNEDHSVCVIFNGEIYNQTELRSELENKGHRFQSDHSDTEVLVHGYEEWGKDLPVRLNGMFAFVVWDRKVQRLFMARDRFGEKPLYCASWASRAPLSCPQMFAEAHTNTVENYFSIPKCGNVGTYHHVSQQHLKRYLAEFDFRYNERVALGVNDSERATRLSKASKA